MPILRQYPLRGEQLEFDFEPLSTTTITIKNLRTGDTVGVWEHKPGTHVRDMPCLALGTAVHIEHDIDVIEDTTILVRVRRGGSEPIKSFECKHDTVAGTSNTVTVIRTADY